jgi:hypothetical protein
MVQLIKIERLGPRIEGMLYRRKFDEVWSLLDEAGATGFSIFAIVDMCFLECKEAVGSW